MTFELTNGRFTARVDSLGAQLTSLKNERGFEHIWVGDPHYWSGQAPVLFPIVGALRGGRAKWKDFTVEMGQHGFARRREFTLTERSEDCVALTLRADAETERMYPFAFAFTVVYRLTEEGYITEFEIVNEGGDEKMPFAVGGHPGFNLPLDEEASFEDYTVVFEKEEHQRCPAIDLSQALIDPSACAFELEGAEIPLRHSLFYADALIFEGLDSRRVALKNKASGRGLEMDFSGFPMLGIWSAANDGPYVCLEPWTGCATRTDEGDDYEKKHGMTLLAPGERFARSFSVRFF